MQVFLGDEVTLIKDREPMPTYITGQVSGIVLDDKSELSRLYIHGIEAGFWMSDGWKLLDTDEDEAEDEI
jgi:hypothetical protein